MVVRYFSQAILLGNVIELSRTFECFSLVCLLYELAHELMNESVYELTVVLVLI